MGMASNSRWVFQCCRGQRTEIQFGLCPRQGAFKTIHKKHCKGMNQYGTHVFGWKWWTWRIYWPLAKMNKSFFWFCWWLNHLFKKSLHWWGCDCHSCHSIAWYVESLRSKWWLLSKSMAKPIAVLVAPLMHKCTCLELLETTKKKSLQRYSSAFPQKDQSAVHWCPQVRQSFVMACKLPSKTSSRFLGTGLKNLSWLNTEMEHPEFVPIWTISKGFSNSCPEVSACWMFHLADKSCLCQNAGQSRQSHLKWINSAAGQNFGAAGQNFGYYSHRRVAALSRSNSCSFAFSPLEYMKDLILLMLFDRCTWSVPFFSVVFLGRPNLVAMGNCSAQISCLL